MTRRAPRLLAAVKGARKAVDAYSAAKDIHATIKRLGEKS